MHACTHACMHTYNACMHACHECIHYMHTNIAPIHAYMHALHACMHTCNACMHASIAYIIHARVHAYMCCAAALPLNTAVSRLLAARSRRRVTTACAALCDRCDDGMSATWTMLTRRHGQRAAHTTRAPRLHSSRGLADAANGDRCAASHVHANRCARRACMHRCALSMYVYHIGFMHHDRAAGRAARR